VGPFLLVCDLSFLKEDETWDYGYPEEDRDFGDGLSFDAQESQGWMQGRQMRENRIHLSLWFRRLVPVRPKEGYRRGII
jgi:hypothetical protein